MGQIIEEVRCHLGLQNSVLREGRDGGGALCHGGWETSRLSDWFIHSETEENIKWLSGRIGKLNELALTDDQVPAVMKRLNNSTMLRLHEREDHDLDILFKRKRALKGMYELIQERCMPFKNSTDGQLLIVPIMASNSPRRGSSVSSRSCFIVNIR